MSDLRQHPRWPDSPLPIAIVGAGAIVKHAHLPAYKMCGWEVWGITDTDAAKANGLAAEFGIGHTFESLAEMVYKAPAGTVFDLAIPAAAILEVLEALPDGSPVLIQKPMGEDFRQAQAIVRLCREKRLKAAVNFQLRYAPYVLAARDAIARGDIGELLDVDVKVHVHMPWEQWTFLEKAPRMEIVYHSIHYLDLILALLGLPQDVKCFTIKHPISANLHSSRSAILLNYGQDRRAQVVSYHAHKYGPRHQESTVRIEGTKGAIAFQMGLNLNYPEGLEDWLDIHRGTAWERIQLEGSWFPHAFRGTMASVMTWAQGGEVAETHVEAALQTMALVEAAYVNAEQPGTPLPSGA